MTVVTPPPLRLPAGPAVQPVPRYVGLHQDAHAPYPRHVARLLALAVISLPLLIPAGPGNTGLADVGIATSLVATAAWLRRSRAKVKLPYLLGVGILMLAGSIAAVHAAAVPSGLTILQDLFCLLWAATVANAIAQRVGLLRTVLKAWCWSGLAWAAVMVSGKELGIDVMAGINARDGGRTSLTFNDPNLAGNYFMCVLFVLLASRVIRNRLVRFLGVVLLFTAIFFTGSNGAGIGICLGLGIAWVVQLLRSRGPIPTMAVVGFVTVVAMQVAPHIDESALRQRAADSVQLLQDSFGRSEESSAERKILFTEGMHLFRTGNLIGAGPSRTEITLSSTAAPYVKEAHDDYIATLVERGLLGGVGLVVLIATIGVRLGRLAWRPLPPELAAIVPRPAMLLGLGCAFIASGFFYEVLHFRQLWCLLGLVAGLELAVRRPWVR